MKTISIKAFFILMGLMLFTSGARAGVIDKFEEFVGTEFNNFTGLYIMAGVVIASLVVYILINHFGKEEESRKVRHGIYSHHRHHHHHRVIKKTS